MFCCEDDYKKGKCICEEGGGSFEIKRGMGSKIIEVDSEIFFGMVMVIIVELVMSFVLDVMIMIGMVMSMGESLVSNIVDGVIIMLILMELVEVVEGGGGLFKGVMIGIGVGVGVVGLLILGVLVFFVMRWRWKNS